MDSTDITQIDSDYTPGHDVEGEYDDEGEYIPWSGGYYAGVGDITHEISGRTRDLVLERVGRTEGRVTVVESHRDGGYCYTCSFEYLVFLVNVDDETVYDSGSYYGDYEGDGPFAMLQGWLIAEED